MPDPTQLRIHARLTRFLRVALLLLLLPPGGARAAEPSPAVPPWTTPADPQRALYRITPVRGQDIAVLLATGVDVAGTGPGGSLDVILDPEEVARALSLGFDPRPLDLTPRGLHGVSESPLGKPGLGAYHTYGEAITEMTTYAAAHPSIAKVDTIGASIEGRAIVAVKISDNVALEEPEPDVLVAGCHHARELMSVELPLYLMRRLLDGYGTDPVLTALVNERQIWVIPVVNPDGYVYVEEHQGGTSDTWWRKNRRPNADGSFGVDLNRNYGYNWGYDNIGSSPTPSSDVYRGTGPFSEPENGAIRDLVAAHPFRISASFHSYGDLFLYPWGYTPSDTPDNPVFQAFGDSVSIQNGYLAGNPKSGAIYETNGDLDDWVYGGTILKPAPYGFTFELNSAADGGFAPSDAQIGPTCELNWGPLLTLLRYADEPRRILPPLRSSRPIMALVAGQPGLMWSYPVRDPLNPPVRHDLRQIASYTVVSDDAESGVADWDSVSFTWSTARSAGGTHSYYSGSGDKLTSVLTARAPVAVVAWTDSIVVQAWWALEQDADYWYAEASADGGVTWQTLPGNRTTTSNPSGNNLGYGVTGSSGGFLRSAFWLGPFMGKQVLLRFCCVTDGATHLEGLYLDDVSPTAHLGGVVVFATATPDTTYAPNPPLSSTTWFQVRPVDAEGQPGHWSDVTPFDLGFTAAEGTHPALIDRLELAGANPFHPGTTLRLTLEASASGPYRLDVFDIRGRLVRSLAGGVAGTAGLIRIVHWDGADDRGVPLGGGVYMIRLQTIRSRLSSKVTLLR